MIFCFILSIIMCTVLHIWLAETIFELEKKRIWLKADWLINSISWSKCEKKMPLNVNQQQNVCVLNLLTLIELFFIQALTIFSACIKTKSIRKQLKCKNLFKLSIIVRKKMDFDSHVFYFRDSLCWDQWWANAWIISWNILSAM